MRFPVTAIYDACVLYPAPLRDLLIRLAQADFVRACWTKQIHDEWMRNVLRDNPAIAPQRLERTRTLMDAAVRDCLVAGYEELIETVTLPDPDDRHVLAAAIRAGAEVIVTFNLSDFPTEILAAYGVEAQHPDEFVRHLLDWAPDMVRRSGGTTAGSEHGSTLASSVGAEIREVISATVATAMPTSRFPPGKAHETDSSFQPSPRWLVAKGSGSWNWLPRACPAEAPVSRYRRRALDVPSSSASPAATKPPRERRKEAGDIRVWRKTERSAGRASGIHESRRRARRRNSAVSASTRDALERKGKLFRERCYPRLGMRRGKNRDDHEQAREHVTQDAHGRLLLECGKQDGDTPLLSEMSGYGRRPNTTHSLRSAVPDTQLESARASRLAGRRQRRRGRRL